MSWIAWHSWSWSAYIKVQGTQIWRHCIWEEIHLASWTLYIRSNKQVQEDWSSLSSGRMSWLQKYYRYWATADFGHKLSHLFWSNMISKGCLDMVFVRFLIGLSHAPILGIVHSCFKLWTPGARHRIRAFFLISQDLQKGRIEDYILLVLRPPGKVVNLSVRIMWFIRELCKLERTSLWKDSQT